MSDIHLRSYGYYVEYKDGTRTYVWASSMNQALWEARGKEIVDIQEAEEEDDWRTIY